MKRLSIGLRAMEQRTFHGTSCQETEY